MPGIQYLILVEPGSVGFSAYAPDLSGCVAAGASRAEVEREMHVAVAFHLEGLRQAGEPIPEPSGLTAAYVKVGA